MEYKFNDIEKKWQDKWKADKVYKVSNESTKPKYYVLDMFPYPSGAGLHVGHPLGYIASDIYSRYKRLKGFNVLHPMGFDSFGLPAEQYAIETGQHPKVTTEKNIATFKSQLDKIGFCYDWEREVQTSDPNYYKWTQWIFLELFNSYFDVKENKAKPISELIKYFETEGSANYQPSTTNFFTADEWKAFDKKTQQDILMNYRLAFSKYGEVNWCEALGTVLANDEVVNGVSERGGHPVVKKKMRQWYLRITAYADRLLEGLETVDFSDSMKDMQRNWIGRSEGAEIQFLIKTMDNGQSTTEVQNSSSVVSGQSSITVYTTRPDTIFGVDFMVVAPELDIVTAIASTEQKTAVEEYIAYVKSRSDVDRMAEKKITGCFTGAYAVNPFNGRQIPIWISEYVLAGYGTGAIMAVPCGDERDFAFAKHFNIPITNIIGTHFTGEEANPTKEATLENSDFLNGVPMKEAMKIVIDKLVEKGIGKRKVNYRMRDAGFSRQRYWGEPFPIQWKDGTAVALNKSELPLELPYVEKYGPGPEGQGPLANIPEWVAKELEVNTMPGYAGSSWYFLRYMDPHNSTTFCDKNVSDYWSQVDLYVGGTEHAVGHLLYSRMWTKVLYDLGYISFDEPFKKLLNQGMIQGSSRFVHRFAWSLIGGDDFDQTLLPNLLVSKEIVDKIKNENTEAVKKVSTIAKEILHKTFPERKDLSIWNISTLQIHVDVNIVDGVELNIEEFKKWRNGEYANAEFILEEDGKYICGVETEKMSKSKYNTVNPNDLCDKYGADTFRMYEMFLGPVEASKPWDTKGIEGVHRFLRKLWRLFNSPAEASAKAGDEGKKVWIDEKATDAELKILHRTIKKIEEDTERFSFNTAVSTFMICVNELADAKCHKKEVLEKLLILLVPYAPHIAEELWHQLGHTTSILDADYPTYNAELLVESSKDYPISINGKLRTNIPLALDLTQPQVEEIVLQNEIVQKWLEGKPPKKIIFVKNKMVNVVV
jgi:leucyl-tRNA synthetase